MTPLTFQEEQVRKLLLDERLTFEAHHVFGLPDGDRISVDFLVFLGAGIVLECTKCEKKRGRAMSEVRRRCAFMDYRFGLLKGTLPGIRCGSLVEAPNEDQEALGFVLRKVLARADFFARSLDELGARPDGIQGLRARR